MTRLVLMLMAFFLAIPILYFLPLGLTVTGSFLLLSIALLIAGGTVFIEPYVPLWQSVLVCLLLVAAMAYFLFKYRGHKIISTGPGNKEENSDEDWLQIQEEMTEKKEEKRLEETEEPSQKAPLFETNIDQTIRQTEEETEPLYIDKEADKLAAGAEQLYEQAELEPAADKEVIPAENVETVEEDLESLLAREEELPVFEQEIPEETNKTLEHEDELYYLESLFDEIIKEEKHDSQMFRVEEKNLETDREIVFENIEEQEEDYIVPLDQLDFNELFEAEATNEEQDEITEALTPKEGEEAQSAISGLEEEDFLYEEEINEPVLEQADFLNKWESEIEEPIDSKEIVDTASELTEEEIENTYQEGEQPLTVELGEPVPELPEAQATDEEQPREGGEKHNQEAAQLPTLESDEPILVLSEAEPKNEAQLMGEEELEEHNQEENRHSILKLHESASALPEEAETDDEEHLEEEIKEPLLEEVERAPLSHEWLHTIIQELELKKDLWSFTAAEEAIQGYLRAPLNDRDYYTVAKLLLSFYIEKGALGRASSWTVELKDRFSAYPIIVQELQLVETYIDEKI